MYPPIPSQRPDDNAPLVPSAGRSLPTNQVEASARSHQDEKQDDGEDKQILDDAHERFKACVDYERGWRKTATEEFNFVDGLDHWTQEQRDERKGLPCLTFDRIGPSIDQVVNDARQNPPEAKVSPVGSGSDKQTAEIIQGLLRNIDNDSCADIAYMTGYEHAVKVGRGWWRVTFDYENDDDSTQKLVIKRIPNPFSVYPDPAAEEFDYSDMRFAFVTEDLDKAVFEDLYRDYYCGSGEFQGLSDQQRDEWFPKGAVRVAEYWWVEITRERRSILQNGKAVPLADIPEGAVVVGSRWVEKRRVRCAKITGAEVLEINEWPGKWIPLVPVLGREIIKDGKRQLRGMIRPAMDANLSYDYMRSKQVQAVALAPIAPWVVVAGQLDGFENKWNEANRVSHPFLEYNQVDNKGNPIGRPPERLVQEPPIAAITTAVQFADNDIKSSLSTYDASLGKAGPESSGRAILARQREGDNAHFHYHDNLGRSMRHTARIEIDLLPHIYTEQRAIAIYDPDNSLRQVNINQPTKTKDGADIIYKLDGATRYDVTIGSGPSYATRRQQGAANLLELVRSVPQPMMRAMDLVVKSLDIPEGDQIADRLRPPDIQQSQDGQAPIPPQVQQKLAQQEQLLQMMHGKIAEMGQLIQSKTLELESAERRNSENNVTRVLTAELAGKSRATEQMIDRDHDAVKHGLDQRLELLHSAMDVQQDAIQHQREVEQDEQQRQHEQQMQAQAQLHEQQMQAQAQQQPPNSPPQDGATPPPQQ